MTAPVTAPATGVFASDTPRSKAGTPLVKIALSRAKKAGGLFETLMKSSGRPVAVGLRANDCQTGTWTFNGKRNRHEIALDPNAHKSVSAEFADRAGAENWIGYFTAILRHEVHHGLLTERDLFRVNRDCAAHGVPFVSLNVAEDIRIDERARATYGKYYWARYYAPDAKTCKVSEPLAWLVWWKLGEGSVTRFGYPVEWTGVKTVERIRIGKPDGKGQRKAEVVLQEFALEFAAAASTLAIVPLLRDLFLTFPAAEKDIGKVGGLPNGAVGHGYSPTNGGDKIANADTVVSMDEAKVGDPATFPKHVQDAVGYFLGHNRRAWDGTKLTGMSDTEFRDKLGRDVSAVAEQGRRVAARLAGLLGSVGGPPSRIALDGNRIHVAGAMVGDARSFRTSARRRGEKPKVVVIFDQSGSMGPDFSQHGAAFMAAFLTLSQQGRMDVTCILTGGGRHAIVPKDFPVNLTGRFYCNEGSESIDKTLDANKALCQSADIVMIYTDGQLTDGHVNAGQWRSHGVDLIGVAVATNEYAYTSRRDALNRHFARGIIAEDGEKLATKIVQYIAAATR